MKADDFLHALQEHAATFARAVATNEGDWIIKGFIDIHRRIYTITIDTKIVSKVLELLLFPLFVEFARERALRLELSPQQNFYPDLTFTDERGGARFAVDIKSTYRTGSASVNGMTLGAFTGYFRNRDSQKNILYPYNTYAGHFVLGVIYTQHEAILDERQRHTLDDLEHIPSVIKHFEFFAQPKYRIASARPGSGNTKNIGSVTTIAGLTGGMGPFAVLGEDIYDDYWMYYLTQDMARALDVKRPYANLQEYRDYKKRGADVLAAHEQEITTLGEAEAGAAEAEG